MARKLGLSAGDVVDAAVAIADDGGWETVTLASVAARLGVRSPSLYAHVQGLEGLRRELALRAAAELGEELRAAVEGRRALEAIRSVARAYRDFARRRPGLYVATQRAIGPEPDAELAAARLAVIEPMLEALDEAGVHDRLERIHLTRGLRSALHGFVDLERLGGFGIPADVDESYDRLVELLVAGVAGAAAARGEAPPSRGNPRRPKP